jgi:hypothetical protein
MGAVDPNSGTASMLEIARGLGALLASGWKPDRTIMLFSWDGEEFVRGHMHARAARSTVSLHCTVLRWRWRRQRPCWQLFRGGWGYRQDNEKRGIDAETKRRIAFGGHEDTRGTIGQKFTYVFACFVALFNVPCAGSSRLSELR